MKKQQFKALKSCLLNVINVELNCMEMSNVFIFLKWYENTYMCKPTVSGKTSWSSESFFFSFWQQFLHDQQTVTQLHKALVFFQFYFWSQTLTSGRGPEVWCLLFLVELKGGRELHVCSLCTAFWKLPQEAAVVLKQDGHRLQYGLLARAPVQHFKTLFSFLV